jgi:hypothetical protein
MEALPLAEMRSFARHWGELFYQAYNQQVRDAAALALHGCGDDSFGDFRHSLICMGREIFERTLRDPDSLADLDLNQHDHCSEHYLWAFDDAYEEVLKKNGLEREETNVWPEFVRPKGLSGDSVRMWERESRYPRLTAKHGHKDASYLWMKERSERSNRKLNYTLGFPREKIAKQGRLSELLLDAGVVRDSGWIPPYRVIARILSDKEFVHGDQCCSWEPFEWNEGDYWQAVSEIRDFVRTEAEQRWPQLGGKQATQDITTPPTDDYAAWVRSLKERALEGEREGKSP